MSLDITKKIEEAKAAMPVDPTANITLGRVPGEGHWRGEIVVTRGPQAIGWAFGIWAVNLEGLKYLYNALGTFIRAQPPEVVDSNGKPL
jgi:hypothetical protein